VLLVIYSNTETDLLLEISRDKINEELEEVEKIITFWTNSFM
jgi:hypothetical protein